MSGFGVMTMDEIVTAAALQGCSVVVAKPNELQFDIDSDESWEAFQLFYDRRLAVRFKKGLSFTEWRSKSGNRHVVVSLPLELNVPERIALQAQGGSDSGREFASLACHWDGSEHPILLFKPVEVANA